MNRKVKYIFLSLIRSTVKFFAFLAVFNIVNILFKRFTEKYNMENRSGWSLAILLFVILSVAWVFYYYNSRAKNYFLESCGTIAEFRKKKSPVWALRSVDFLIDAMICFALSLITAFVFEYEDIEMLFFERVNLNDVLKNLIIGILIGLVFLFVQWFTVYDVRKRWFREKDIPLRYEVFIISGYLCLITVMYTVGFYLAISYVPGIPSYIFLFKELFGVIVALITAILILIYFNRINKRKKFISKLKKCVRESGFELSKIEKPYLSVFKKVKGASFAVTAHQKTYQCKLISGKRKGVPIIFSDQGFLVFRRIIRIGKTELFSIYSKYDYTFESDVKKCLIITCIPADCYFKDSNGHMHKIDTGEKIGEYTVYNSQGFLGALERDCLDRS